MNTRRLLVLALLASSLLCAAPRAEETCSTIAQCGKLGDAAYKKGDFVGAARWYERQIAAYWDWQADNGTCTQADSGCPDDKVPVYYNNVALALLRAGQPLKARAWLEAAPDSPATTHNRTLIDKALKDWKWPATPEGEYWSSAGYGSWDTVSVRRAGGGWTIHWEGLRFPATGMKFGPNMGEFDTQMPLDARRATYSEDGGCTVTISFSDASVKLEQGDTDCASFGYGVTADGTFARVSTTAPAADAP